MKRGFFIVALCCASVRLFAETPIYEGLPLAEALEDLRARGLDIVYSSRLVRPEMRVVEEPSSTVPRQILDEILPPHGLRAEDGSGGRILVVRKPEESERTDAPVVVTPFRPFRFTETVKVVAPAASQSFETNGIHLLPNDIENVAGSVDDVFRVVQTLPGVATPSELGSRVVIRGGAPDQNLILMDGVEIYNPFRLFGFTSAFNPETVGRFDLLASSFAPRYGDRLSSTFVVENRVGRKDKLFQGSFGASLLDANIVLEGRLPKARGSWLLAGRRTYYDLAADAATNADFPSFGDLQTKISWELRPGQRLSFTGLLGSESTALDSTTLDSGSGSTGLVENRFRLFGPDPEEAHFELDNRSRTRLFAVNFESSVGSKIWSRTTVSYYRFLDGMRLEGLVETDTRQSRTRDEPLSEVLFSRDVEVEDIALRQEVAVELGQNHRLGVGFELHDLETRWQYASGGVRSLAEPNATGLSFYSQFLPGASLPEQLDSTVDFTRWGLWLSNGFHATPRIFLQPGLRVDRSGIHGKTSVSPRLDASIELGRDTRLRAATGLYFQSPGYEKLFQSDYFVDLSDEATRRGLDSERAFVVSVGLDWAPMSSVSVSVDGYHRSHSNLIVGRLETEPERLAHLARYDFPPALAGEIPSHPVITTVPVNGGSGRAFGVDVSLTKRATSERSRFSGWITYSYGASDREAYARRYPFDYDRPHAGSLVGRVRLTRSFELSFTGRVASGFPRTPAIGTRVAAEEDRRDIDGDGDVSELVPARDRFGALIYTQDFGDVKNRNSARWPSFARLDARFTYRTGGGEGRWLFYLEFLNLLNRDNTLVVNPIIAFDGGRPFVREENVSSIPLMPNFGLRFRF